jgi:hypothetical protein
MAISLRSARLGLMAVALWSAAALALDKPAGKVVLTISGAVGLANSGTNAVFDMAMLEKLPQKSFTTQTPWYPKPVTFTGPLLRDVLAAAGAKGGKIVAVALNDYKTDIPFDDATKFDPIVARLLDNKPMSIREKGPLFIVYPFDTAAELRTEMYYNRSAWQLSSLRVQ